MHRGLRRSAGPVLNRKITRYVSISAEQFRDARIFSGLDREDAADLLGVSLRTIGHWETGRSRPSYAAFKLLRVYRHGDLIDPAWSGYRLVRGRLVTPEGHAFVPGDMAWLGLLVRRAAAFSDLLQQRDRPRPAVRREERGGARAKPAPATASEASLGLVHYSTSDTRPSLRFQFKHENQSLSPSCALTFVGPYWPHERRHPQAQFEATHGLGRRGQNSGGSARRLPECIHPVRAIRAGEAGSPGFASLWGASFKAPSGEACFINNAPAVRFARLHGEGQTGPARWPQRSVPVRQRSQGQALPPRELLTPGGAP